MRPVIPAYIDAVSDKNANTGTDNDIQNVIDFFQHNLTSRFALQSESPNKRLKDSI